MRLAAAGDPLPGVATCVLHHREDPLVVSEPGA